MSEREPQPEEKWPSIEHNGIKFELKPDNTAVYLHEEEPQFDHMFYSSDGGYFYLFRRAVQNFDDTAKYLENKGFEVVSGTFASAQDKEQYFELYGYPEIPRRELTPREERCMKFVHYCLEREIVTPESFADGTL